MSVSRGSHTRDPVSLLFDAGARRLLERAYAAPRGVWAGTRLANPTAEHIAHFAARGINVLGGDNAQTMGGGRQDARSRWARGFVRAVYYQHKWYFARGELQAERRTSPNSAKPIEFDAGRMLPSLGVLPAGRAVRIRVAPSRGRSPRRAVERMADGDRIWLDDGEPGGRFSDPTGRDWE